MENMWNEATDLYQIPKYRYEIMYIPELGLLDSKPWVLRIFSKTTDNIVFHYQYETLSEITDFIRFNEYIRESKKQ